MPPHRGRGRGEKKLPPQHRVYQPGKRHMELIASVSRSSGLEKDGDALRDPKIQEEYRQFIQGKVDDYWRKYPLGTPRESTGGDAEATRNMREAEANLLILFRKLREGLLSTQRRDAFALEVYETSLHLSVLFRSPVHTTSTLSHLFPDFYIYAIPSPSASQPTPSTSKKPNLPPQPTTMPNSTPKPIVNANAALSTILIFLLHHLVTAYPSQIAFHTQLRQLHPTLQDILRAPPPGEPSNDCDCDSSLRASPEPAINPRSTALPARASSQQPPAPTPLPPRSAASPSASARHAHASHDHQAQTQPDNTSTSVAASPASDPLKRTRAPSHTSPPPCAHDWLRDLARRLRERNYARLDALTRREAFGCYVLPIPSISRGAIRPIGGTAAPCSQTETETETEPLPGPGPGRNLALETVRVLVESLLEKARGRTWDVLRTAYREVSLRAAPAGLGYSYAGGGTTGEWLARSLVLRTSPSPSGRQAGGSGVGGEVGSGKDVVVDAWLDERRGRGEARRKEGEGMKGRWILVKA